MKKLLNFVIILVIYGSNLSCIQKNENDNVQYFTEFPSVTNIKFNNYLTLDSTIGGDKIFLMDTSFIVTNLSKLTKSYFFYEYSMNTKKLVGKYIKWGTGKEKTYAPMSSGVYDKNKLWLHDLALKKFLSLSIQTNHSSDTIKDIREFRVPEFAYSTQLMKNNKLLESGFFISPEYLRIVDINTNQQLRHFNKFEKPNNDYPFYTWKASYEGFLFLRPDEKRAALSCRYTDKVFIFDITSNAYKIIQGPINFEPKFIGISDSTINNYSISRTTETTFAFIGGAVTNQYIYLIFSGKKENENGFFKGKKIFVYDWNGKPVRQLLIDHEVSTIAVTSDDKKLFAIDSFEHKIIEAKLNN